MGLKRGVVEVQFNWIFVLIAGAVVLMFFVNFAMDYREAGETQIAAQILQDVGSLASSSLQAAGTAQDVEFGGVDLEISCNADTCTDYGCDQEFSFGGRDIMAPEWMDLEPIFSSKDIDSDHLILWTLPWQAPYHVTNFLYLTDPEHRFIFVCDEDCDLSGEVVSQVRDNIYLNEEYHDLDNGLTISDEGENQHNFVFFMDPDEFDLDDFDGVADSVKERSNILFIDPDESNEDYGEVTFTSVDREGFTRLVGDNIEDKKDAVPYVGIQMLIGAIYSDSKDDYVCNVRKAMLRYKDINNIYKDKSSELEDECGDEDRDCYGCDEHYDDSDGSAQYYIEDLNQHYDVDFDDDFPISDAGSLHETSEDLAGLNRNIYRQGCPRVY